MSGAPEVRDPPTPSRRWGELLIERGLITPGRLDDVMEMQRAGDTRPLGDILLAAGDITRKGHLETLAILLGRPFVNLSQESITSAHLQQLPEALLEKYNILPIRVEDGRLLVAAERFTDVFLAEELSRKSTMPIRIVAADGDDIRRVRQQLQRRQSTDRGVTARAAERSLDRILEEIGVDDLRVVELPEEDTASLESHATESPIVKLVNFIIKSAVQASASDIHIEPSETCFRVRYRVDGDLSVVITPPLKLLAAVVSRIKILSGMDITERRLPQDGGLTVNLFERAIDLRISTMATKFGEKVVMRIVDRSAGICELDSIGMPAPMLERFRVLLREPNGMVLVTGPTGSGKSTTLYGALQEMVSDVQNASTIEDPIERVIAGVNQFQVHTAAGFTFAGALRSMLRQDPDVIMVGEIRDKETAKLATEAALTGHLVLSTLHTNDAPTAIPRLVNMGVEPYLVAASLRGVLAQRLCRRLCPECVEPVALSHEQSEAIARLTGRKDAIECNYRGRGCHHCADSGYRGRIGVFDLLQLNEQAVSRALSRDMSRTDRQGLIHDGVHKVRQGVISVDALLRVVSALEDPSDESHAAFRLAS